MRYNTSKNLPGDWGYRCKVCSNIAFAFIHGEPVPGENEYIENVEVAQRGTYASVKRSKHICQHCQSPVSSVGGTIDPNCVVYLPKYRKALQKRLNSSSARGRKGYGNTVVDYDFMGVGWTDKEKEDILSVPVKVEEPKDDLPPEKEPTTPNQPKKAKKAAQVPVEEDDDAVANAVGG